MKQVITTFCTLLAFSFVLQKTTFAEETASEKAQEVTRDAGRSVKKGYRKVKDETCEYIKGKMECTKDRVKHGLQNTGDKVEDKMD